ncbi:hypothetical protein [Lentibacillus saliphilus]|uniref:hypothetical protein n=1 Tax=Lentibacillus saliphilus TaxID=2737028 RepID=UPI001C30850B|nr:hypothetical protein [Lentibacillus saliphilus]
MFDAGWLNIGSLILGLAAWITPIVSLLRNKQQTNNKLVTFSIISFSACSIAICLQIFYNLHLVRIEDWAALMDTIGAVAFVSTVLVIVTILLNVFTLIFYRDKTAL